MRHETSTLLRQQLGDERLNGLLVAAEPLVKALASDAVIPTGSRDVASDLLGTPEHREAVLDPSLLLSVVHLASLSRGTQM